jgi:hypothetical protein
MATKPLLPEVVAERAKAAEDYRKAHQAAIDRIDKLRAAREKRDAALQSASVPPAAKKTQAPPTGKQAVDKRTSAAGEKRARAASARADAGSEA